MGRCVRLVRVSHGLSSRLSGLDVPGDDRTLCLIPDSAPLIAFKPGFLDKQRPRWSLFSGGLESFQKLCDVDYFRVSVFLQYKEVFVAGDQ
jgi:hypothetical protein